MALTKLILCGGLVLVCLPSEPNLGFGQPQLSSQLLETARETIRERLVAVREDLAEHSAAAVQIRKMMERTSKT